MNGRKSTWENMLGLAVMAALGLVLGGLFPATQEASAECYMQFCDLYQNQCLQQYEPGISFNCEWDGPDCYTTQCDE